MLVQRRVRQGAHGGTLSNCLGWRIGGQKIDNIKYIEAFGGCCWSIILHTTINQKQLPVMGESMERMCDQVVGAGKVQ